MKNCENLDRDYAQPQNKLEGQLCRAFAAVFGLEKASATDDFVHLGGTSGQAEKLLSQLSSLPLQEEDIRNGRTPRGIAALLSARQDEQYRGIPRDLDRVPLTESQMGIYLQCMQRPQSLMYNVLIHYTYVKPENATEVSVKKAIDSVLCLHPALYAQICADGEEPFMRRLPFPKDGICLARLGKESEIPELLKSFNRLIPMDQSPLCQVQAFLTESNVHILFNAHHIVSDGGSVTALGLQFAQSMAGEELSEETVSSFMLSEAEKRSRSGEDYEKARQYFEKLLSGVEIDSMPLPDGPKTKEERIPSMQTIKRMLLPGLDAYLRKYSLTKGSFFMGVFAYVLAKMTGQKESLFGAAESGRGAGNAHDMTVCMMVKTLPVVVSIDESKPAAEMLQAVQKQFFTSIRYDSVSIGELCREYGINTEVLFVYQGDLMNGLKTSLGRAEMEGFSAGEAFSALSAALFREKDAYCLKLETRSDCYLPETAKRFAELYEAAAKWFITEQDLRELPLIGVDDLAFLDGLNRTESPYDAGKTIVDLFRQNARSHPDKTALVCKEERYTYAQADDITDRLAAYLHSCGIGKGSVVSVLIPRCAYMMLASMGIMKAGAMYQPLDPAYPPERLAFMCKDAESALLITTPELRPLLPEYSGKILLTEEIPSLPQKPLDFEAPSPEDGYILLYTSGTTGTPKGCKLIHSNLSCFVHAWAQSFCIDADSRSAAYASYGFDAHMADIYPTLSQGGEVHIIWEEIRFDLPALRDYCEQAEITHMIMTTQLGRQFATEYPLVKPLRYLMTGGEKLVPFDPCCNYRMVNGYGPTECTVAATGFVVDRFYDDIPIGTALPNSRLYVVDTEGRRLPVGVPGEMIISGPQVAAGYLNREEQTKKVFVSNTFEKDAPGSYEHCYRTGDIVRFLPDGNLQFIGRRDQQVKIRGFRIELSEVERVIRDFPGITDAAVVARDDPSGGKCIHAYVVSSEKVDIQALNAFIRGQKPAYMVPAATLQIDTIPLTPNLKVDRRKLPPIQKTGQTAGDSGPRALTELEKALFAVAGEVLGAQQWDVQLPFADAGLSSISSIRLAVALYKQFGLHISSKELLDGESVLSIENRIVSQLQERKGAPSEEGEQEKRDAYPLTQTQIGIYTDCMRVGMDAYNIPMLLKLPASIDTEKLKKAIAAAVKAHPSMLCCIHTNENGDAMVYPLPELEIAVTEEHTDTLPPPAQHFAFGEEPLFRIHIVDYQGEKYLSIDIHHIIGDGESMLVLLRDIALAYDGKEPENESYTSFELALEEEKQRNGAALAEAKAYYDSVFRGIETDYLPQADRKAAPAFGKLDYQVAIPDEEIRLFCKKLNISENIFFTGAYALTIARYTAHEDALIATIHNGRSDPRTQNMVAMLVKTLPVYLQTAGESTVSDYLHSLDERLRMLKKYDLYSFADAAKDYGIRADTLFIYQGELLKGLELAGEMSEQIVGEQSAAKAELSVEVQKKEKDWVLCLEYNGGHYSPEWIATFADSYAACLRSLLSCEKLSDVSICSEKAFEAFHTFNDTDWPVVYRPAYRMFEESVDRHPDKTAVIAAGEQLTYRQLDELGNQLAHRLRENGIESGDAVMIMTGRTKEIYAAETGILKAGGAFLFVSPEWPDERIRFVAEDAGAKALVTTHAASSGREALLSALKLPVYYADELALNGSSSRLELTLEPDSLCYMIYTSGSTGKPKGIMISQKNFATIADHNPKNNEIPVYADDETISAAVTAFTFDASLCDGLMALCGGSTVCIAGEEEIHNPVAMTGFCLEHHIGSILATPSFMMNMLEYDGFAEAIRSMKVVLLGGEDFTAPLYEHLRSLNPKLRILNGYGPSEATVTCSCKELTSAESITVGTPITNTKIYCLDKWNHVLPMGALGELVIVGDGVGKGYLNREDLTKKAFVTLFGKPSFKTGDLALISHEGEIEFHGRMDNQVKLRGLRVELGEIENAINACDGVKMSVVTVNGDESNRYLAAYYVASKPVSAEEITEQISKTLTEYMVPRILIQLPNFPLTANGKVDKKALPKPELQTEKHEYVEPATEEERLFCEIFAKTLKLEKVGALDDFFALGGTSLTATKVAMYALSHEIPIVYADVFKNPTPRQLALLAETSMPVPETVREKEHYSNETEKLLSANEWHSGDDAGDVPLGNVLLTGATGFLGIHVLHSFLLQEKGEIYCLIHGEDEQSAQKRLQGMYIYYFEEDLESAFAGRVHCVAGDISDKACVSALEKLPFDTLVNCAACVKHFVKDDTLEKVNVQGVANLAELCGKTGRRLIQVSTVSIAGESVGGTPSPEHRLHENELYFHQIMENEYIQTKFRAEKLVLEAACKGLDAKIMRVGNLMPRRSDGEFQLNFLNNGFMRRLKAYYALHCLPYSVLSSELEFSPIDETAGAILCLAKTDKRYTVFHANNTHRIYMSDVVRAMNEIGLSVETVAEESFALRLKAALEKTDTNENVGVLISYMNRDQLTQRCMLDYDNSFTRNVLDRKGYSWYITDDDYLRMALMQLRDLGFFELNL